MKTLLLIDASALVHRAFHALPPLTGPNKRPVGALYGLAAILIKILSRPMRDPALAGQEPYDYIAALFDRPEPTFRKERFNDYKIHRPKAPDELISQIKESRNLFSKFNIKTFEMAGFEADDLIGTLTKKFKQTSDLQIKILTGDLDTLQLIEDDKVVVEFLKTGVSEIKTYNEVAVIERYGLLPKQLPDFKGLVGDVSDNIPGVAGIGPKTAAPLISKYQTLDKLFIEIERDSSMVKTTAIKKILENKEQALLSRDLAQIHCDVPVEIKNLSEIISKDFSKDVLKEYFQELGFTSLINRINNISVLLSDVPEITDQRNIAFLDQESVKKNSQILTSKEITKVGFGLKDIFEKTTIDPPYFDVLIASQLIDPDNKVLDSLGLAKKFLRKEFKTANEAIPFLYSFTSRKLKEYSLGKVFDEIEMPLVPILAEMEKTGVLINLAELKLLKKEVVDKLKELTEKIYQEAGAKFNINSPKQLSAILLEKFKIKLLSTRAEKLVAFKTKYEIIGSIFDYRELFKIKSTYINPLEKLADDNNRVHTTFLQLGAATGRLSSKNPNLLNIPKDGGWANKLRKIFIAPKGYQFVSFDYSQIELRVLGSVSQDKKIINAFLNDLDIHKMTASQVFNQEIKNVIPQMRNIAKTLNFGVVYGMGARAFSQTSGLSLQEAKKFIEEYFRDFSGVREWQEKIKEEARIKGYVENLNHRRRWVFDSTSFNPRQSSEAERVAVNMPIQGLAADILKLAMIKIKEKLIASGLGDKVRLLLAIHDELLFEIKDEIIEKGVIDLIKAAMISAYQLAVPLKVEIKIGQNWGTMEKV